MEVATQPLLNIEQSEVDPRKFRRFRGELEKIIDDPKHPSRPWLVWNNFYFGRKMRTKVRIIDWFRSVNAPLALNPDLFDEVRKYVFQADVYSITFRLGSYKSTCRRTAQFPDGA